MASIMNLAGHPLRLEHHRGSGAGPMARALRKMSIMLMRDVASALRISGGAPGLRRRRSIRIISVQASGDETRASGFGVGEGGRSRRGRWPASPRSGCSARDPRVDVLARIGAGTHIRCCDALLSGPPRSVAPCVSRIEILKPGVVLKFVSGGDTYELEALRTKGGLLQSFKLNGWSILFNRPYEDQMDGTSFWPAPQSVWGWPPPRELDPTPSNDYNTEYDLSVDEDGKSFKMTSPVSKRFNIRVSKKATVDAERLAFVLDYEIENMGSEPQRWAPWEISRVKPNGLTFFLTGTHTSSGSWPKLPTTQEGGVTWFSQDAPRVRGAGAGAVAGIVGMHCVSLAAGRLDCGATHRRCRALSWCL